MNLKNKIQNSLSESLKANADAEVDKEFIHSLEIASELLIDTFKSKGKVLLAGNGGSAADSQHIAAEFMGRLNFDRDPLPAIALTANTSNLTCIANDYGYERWVEKAIDFYADKKDSLILISSSGKSQNMINACKLAKRKKISNIISFTGHKKNSPVAKLADINFWVDSKAYNFIENTHQVWLLTICDLIIGKREYPASKKNNLYFKNFNKLTFFFSIKL